MAEQAERERRRDGADGAGGREREHEVSLWEWGGGADDEGGAGGVHVCGEEHAEAGERDGEELFWDAGGWGGGYEDGGYVVVMGGWGGYVFF